MKEEDEEVAAAEAGRTLVEAGLEDYQKITLPRRRLARWCNEPYFKEAVLNCFVKLFIGENERGKRCYRLCKIVDVTSAKPYQLPPVKNQKAVSFSWRRMAGVKAIDFSSSVLSCDTGHHR